MNSVSTTQPSQSAIAEIIVKGNLAMLSDVEKANYYLAVCNACGLNPATRPFEFINMKGKLVLYALKSCTEQLRKRDSVNITVIDQTIIDGLYVVRVKATMPDQRSDEDLAAVCLSKWEEDKKAGKWFQVPLEGEERANAIMKAITKAKRRVTLSLCGLGMLDESEVGEIEPVQIIQRPAAPLQIAELTTNGKPASSVEEMAIIEQQKTQREENEEAARIERFEVEQDCIQRAERLGFAAKFDSFVQKAYGIDLRSLSVEQIAELQQRLIKKEAEALRPKKELATA